METVKLYYSDPLMREVPARVTSVRGNAFLLDRTIFYPEGGGQRGDSGTFGPYRIVTTVKDENSNPLHVTDGPLPQVGDEYMLRLDWDERYYGMVEHTAQHLISSVLFHRFSIATTAVHHGKDEITVETDFSDIPLADLLETELECIRHIGENRRVRMEEMTRSDAALVSRRSIKVDDSIVRVVIIDGLDAVACGGVHLPSTGEIGELAYAGSDMIRGCVRTHWRVGRKATEMRRRNAVAVREAGRLLSSECSALIPELERVLEENRSLKHEISEICRRRALDEFCAHHGSSIVYSTDCDLDCLAAKATEDRKRRVFIKGSGNTFLFAGTKAEFDELKGKLHLRGGGKEPLFRGRITGGGETVLSEAESILRSFQNQ